MKKYYRTLIAKIPLAKPLYHAVKRWWNILVMKSVQPVMNVDKIIDIEKQIIKNIKHLLKIESMLSEFYDVVILPKKECPVCGGQTEVFLPFIYDNNKKVIPSERCPYCNSAHRHRCYWPILKEWFENIKFDETVKLLHFAPERGFRANIEQFAFIDHWPVDINLQKDIREVADITNIQFNDNEFDFIICNHVLEHVADEAMSELYREGGKAMINVPIE